MDYISEFVDFMNSHGIEIFSQGDIKADGAVHRIRLDNDSKGQTSCIYKLSINEYGASGRVTSFKHGGETIFFTARSKGYTKWTPEQKAAWKAKVEEEKRLDREAAAAGYEAAANEAKDRYKTASLGGESNYLIKKNIKPNKIKFEGDNIIIPGYDGSRICTLQIIQPDGTKLFLPGGKLNGSYYPIVATPPEGEKPDTGTFLICEGWATGESLHAATGLSVIVAWNAGNLLGAAKTIKAKYPDTRLVFCADNDQWRFDPAKKPKDINPKEVSGDDPRWTQWREAGLLHNIGFEMAKQAAVAVKGAPVIVPGFATTDPDKNSDWNDAACILGIDYVKDRIAEVMAVNAKSEAIGHSESVIESYGPDDAQRLGGDPYYEDVRVNYDIEPMSMVEGKEEYFNILGHDEGMYYFLPRRGGQIVAMAPVSMNQIVNLCRLAPIVYWEGLRVETESNKKLAERMTTTLIMECENKGIFQPYNIKGVGMWKDKETYVMHCGNQLFINGSYIKPHKFNGKNAYPLRQTNITITDSPLNNKEANKLRDLCKQISWENKLSADLLAGWCVIAPICAVLKWRPHIWVTGPSQGGKTTVLEKIVRPVVGNIGLYFEGGTTEAAFRQLLGCDGRPIILDESESESQKDKMITQDILLLARRSSSGAMIAKGSSGGKAQEYTIRSTFCFSSINTPIKQRADESRISKLKIVKDRSDGAAEKYKKLEIELDTILTEEFGRRLLTRTVLNIDVLMKNINTFVSAAAIVLKDKRAADQIAPMLAGLYLLTSTKEVTHQEAILWIEQQDWSLHTAIKEKTDPERFIEIVVSRSIRFQKNGSIQEFTIGSLIEMALDDNEDAEKKLREYGIWPRDKFIWLSNASPRLEELLKDTPWSSWKGFIIDLKDSERKDPVLFSPGLKSRAVAIPLSYFDIKDDHGATDKGNDLFDGEEIEF